MENQETTPQTNITDIPTPTLQQNAKDKKTNNLLVILLFIFFLGASGLAGFFAYQNFQLKKEQPKSTPTPAAGFPSSTNDPTANWETYSNTSAGFIIKYPIGWRKIETENGVGFGPKEIGEDVTWGVSYHNKSDKTIDQIKDEVGNQFSDRKQTEESVTFKGLTATKVVTTTNEFEDWYAVSIIIDSGNMLYKISNGAVTDKINNEVLTKRTGKKYNISFEDFYTSFTRLIDQTQTTSQIIKANLVTTDGWVNASLGNLSVKVPAKTSVTKSNCTDEPYTTYEECYLISGHDNSLLNSTSVTIKTKIYQGGSRREEAGLTQNPGTYTYAEKAFGDNTGLEAVFNCEIDACTAFRQILLVVNNRLILVSTTTASESPVINTIVSTIN